MSDEFFIVLTIRFGFENKGTNKKCVFHNRLHGFNKFMRIRNWLVDSTPDSHKINKLCGSCIFCYTETLFRIR